MWTLGLIMLAHLDDVKSLDVGAIAYFETDCPEGWRPYTNLNGRVVVSAGNYSGLSEDGRIEVKTYTTGDTGGEISHKLTENELTKHNHYNHNFNYNYNYNYLFQVQEFNISTQFTNFAVNETNNMFYIDYTSIDINETGRNSEYPLGSDYNGGMFVISDDSIATSGNDSEHNNLPPYYVLQACVKHTDGLAMKLMELQSDYDKIEDEMKGFNKDQVTLKHNMTGLHSYLMELENENEYLRNNLTNLQNKFDQLFEITKHLNNSFRSTNNSKSIDCQINCNYNTINVDPSNADSSSSSNGIKIEYFVIIIVLALLTLCISSICCVFGVFLPMYNKNGEVLDNSNVNANTNTNTNSVGITQQMQIQSPSTSLSAGSPRLEPRLHNHGSPRGLTHMQQKARQFRQNSKKSVTATSLPNISNISNINNSSSNNNNNSSQTGTSTVDFNVAMDNSCNNSPTAANSAISNSSNYTIEKLKSSNDNMKPRSKVKRINKQQIHNHNHNHSHNHNTHEQSHSTHSTHSYSHSNTSPKSRSPHSPPRSPQSTSPSDRHKLRRVISGSDSVNMWQMSPTAAATLAMHETFKQHDAKMLSGHHHHHNHHHHHHGNHRHNNTKAKKHSHVGDNELFSDIEIASMIAGQSKQKPISPKKTRTTTTATSKTKSKKNSKSSNTKNSQDHADDNDRDDERPPTAPRDQSTDPFDIVYSNK